MSTARMTSTPLASRFCTRWPPINPPAPQTTAFCPLRFILGEDSFSKVYKFEAIELIQVICRIVSKAPRVLFSIAGGGLVFRVTLLWEGDGWPRSLDCRWNCECFRRSGLRV